MAFERFNNWRHASAGLLHDSYGFLGIPVSLAFSGAYGLYQMIDYIASSPLFIGGAIGGLGLLTESHVLPGSYSLPVFLAQHGLGAIAHTTTEVAGILGVSGASAYLLKKGIHKIPHASDLFEGMGGVAEEHREGKSRRGW